ncbi:MAG TPA: hypothetical protein VK446_11920 [Methylocystis sp.]|nr:hypothetical protein [Methylocystis sp.]
MRADLKPRKAEARRWEQGLKRVQTGAGSGRKKVILHIGLEKTGTTSFQRFCFENSRVLRARGVLYPTQSLAFSRRSHNHASLVAAYLEGTGYVDLDMTPSWRGREETLASLRQEIEAAQAPTILLSAEHFSSRLTPVEIGRLAADFADCDCVVAIVVRAHEPRVCSAYSSTIRSGRDLTLDEFVAELATPGNAYLRYAETVLRWEHAFGRENIRLFNFEKSRDLIADLIRNIVGPGFTARAGAQYVDNKRYGAVALEALRRINADFPRPDGSGRSALKLRLAAHARAMLLRAFSIMTWGNDASLRLNAGQCAALAAVVQHDRTWLEENYGVVMPALCCGAGEPPRDERVAWILARTRRPREVLARFLNNLPD